MTKTKRQPRSMFSPNPLASRESILRVLSIGGAMGAYGFGRYPEGVLGSMRRWMAVEVAK